MLRAIGLKRRDLVRMFLVEGALYALASSVLGALLGVAVGRVVILVTSGIFAYFGDLTLLFTVEPLSVVTGSLAGLLISLATALVTIARISRVNIIRRALCAPPARRLRAGAGDAGLRRPRRPHRRLRGGRRRGVRRAGRRADRVGRGADEPTSNWWEAACRRSGEGAASSCAWVWPTRLPGASARA